MENFTEKSINGLKELLESFDNDDLISLVNTVTQRLLKPAELAKPDAIKTIILHSPDAKSILKRKSVTREILFNYLNDKNIPILPPITKESLINNILFYWNENNTGESGGNQIYRNTQNIPTEGGSNQNDSTTVSSFNQSVVYEMAVQFAKWFYEMFNENKPIDREHFWQNCDLKANLHAGSNVINEQAHSNVNEVVNILYRIKSGYDIYLNPNLNEEGITGKMNSHGLVVVLTCGTIHSNSCVVGVFEQVFGLARDPQAENNWKVKFTELNLRSQSNVTNYPRLTDGSLSCETALSTQ